MTGDCQEAMGVESQAPERIAVGDASLATIESLRARLLSERAASKEAQQHVKKIALKVSELQSRLDAETEQRRKAEVAMKEVLEALRAKGLAIDEVMTAMSSISGSSESEEAARLSSSKDGESENSSGEEASQVHIENHQCSLLGVSHIEAKRSLLGSAEDCPSDKTQITLTDSSRNDDSEVDIVGESKNEGSLMFDNFEVEKQGMTENEKANNHEQVILTEIEKADNHERVLWTDGMEELAHAVRDQVGKKINISQPPEILGDSAKLLEGQVMTSTECELDVDCVNGSSSKLLARAAASDEVQSESAAIVSLLGGHQLFAPLLNEASSSHVDDVEKPKEPLLDESSQTLYAQGDQGDVEKSKGDESLQTHNGRGDQGAHGGERLHPVDDKMAGGPLSRDMAPLVKESTLGLGHTHMIPGLFPRGGYPYESPYMSGDPFQHMHCVTSAEVPFSRVPMSTAYGDEYGRYPLAPISDSVLSLVDDKSGKLGSILMALNLAKQQINENQYTACFVEEVCEAVSQGPFRGKPYPGLYEGVAHQPCYRPWRPEPQNQAPIIHFPTSPTSDYDASSFDRHDGVGRSSSTPAYFTPGYDPYLQPKGELHLGNGITLYTD